MKVVLASKSPRRREILSGLGVKFNVVTAETDERSAISTPGLLVEELSKRKGKAVSDIINDKGTLVISADTVVYCDGKILGKPKDKEDAARMLKLISGRKHTVVSGVSLFYNGELFTGHESTDVYFSELSDKEIRNYVDSGEPMDKAGAYAIQGFASLWIDRIEGCYFNVVGFPTRLFCKLLGKAEIDIERLIIPA